MSYDLAHIEQCRAEIAVTAQQMLDGKCSYIEGSRKILLKLRGARIDCYMKPFIIFTAIDSETGAIPVGTQLGYWADDAIARFRADWDAAEAWAKNYGETACRETILWIEGNQSTSADYPEQTPEWPAVRQAVDSAATSN
ncbi:hypothetical protein [Methylorubrum populi]|uniref:hypothetical protein n=1 Tax=Methylorubrum populi TaxID=223967 RepID=UPI00126586C6|nr:hypothetical protein [Methylorubrum populi]